MKTFLPIIALAFTAASCSTAYKSGQTPDDVYFSPGRPQQEEYVRVEKKDNRQYRSDNNRRYEENDQYNGYEDEDDRYLRMKVRNRQRWSALDYDDWYNYSPYAYGRFPGAYTGVNLYFGSPLNYGYWDPFWHRNQYFYNPYGFYSPYRSSYYGHMYGGYYGNPYYGGSPYYGGGNVIINNYRPVYSRPRSSNMRVYNTPRTNGRNTETYTQPGANTRPSSPRRSGGPDLRAIFNDGNSSSPSYSPGGRSSSNNNSSSGSSNSSSSGGSGRSSGSNAPVRRF